LLLAAFVLFIVCFLWLVLFLLFLPFIVIGEVFGLKRRLPHDDISSGGLALREGGSLAAAQLRTIENRSTDNFIFDRRKDISKLFGCNTRYVQYRWSIFGRRLADLKAEFTEPRAIDFGDGSFCVILRNCHGSASVLCQ